MPYFTIKGNSINLKPTNNELTTIQKISVKLDDINNTLDTLKDDTIWSGMNDIRHIVGSIRRIILEDIVIKVGD